MRMHGTNKANTQREREERTTATTKREGKTEEIYIIGSMNCFDAVEADKKNERKNLYNALLFMCT